MGPCMGDANSTERTMKDFTEKVIFELELEGGNGNLLGGERGERF